MMGWYGNGMGGGAWLFMGVFWVVLIALIVWLVIRLLPAESQGRSGADSGRVDSALDILDRRLALGEIDVETYQAQRRALLEARGTRK